MQDNFCKDYTWIIHLVEGDFYRPCLCNAHTHGMGEFGHPDFQIVMNVGPELIGYILNELGDRVRNGEIFYPGNTVTDVIEEPFTLRLASFEETGRSVLRVLIPDENGRFPEDPECDPLYKLQLLSTSELEKCVER